MNKAEYNSPLRNQVFSLPELVDIQLERSFCSAKLQSVASIAEIFDARKIILTGCGDSLAAAAVMAPVLKKYSGVFGCKLMDAMEFTRFTSKGDIGIGEPNSPFVIVVSAGGSTARIREALEKANKVGAFSILVTNKDESPAASAAKRVYFQDTPPMENDFPGLRSYFASIVGLAALANRMGHVRGLLHPCAEQEWKKAISGYVHSYEKVLDAIDDQMFELAQTWKDFERFDFIGDGTELYSALFCLEKVWECNGVCGAYDDSEGWCHVDYFLRDPETVGTVVMADKNSPSFSRTVETIASAYKIGRPVLVVTNADKNAFIDGVTVCTLPDTPEGFEWLMPMMDYVPASILASYCCTLKGRKYFNAYDPFTNVYDHSVKYFDKNILTMSSSKVEIFE